MFIVIKYDTLDSEAIVHMCGIAGYIGSKELESSNIERCLGKLSRRGPDSAAHKKYKTPAQVIALLHARLSIIDVKEHSNQPFLVDDFATIFNGELYNYLEIRKVLEGQGIKFRTDSDTEVFLRAFIFYGTAAFEKFEGMWAAAIYKEGEDRILLTRDRFGEKPLYYTSDPRGFYFASEIKALSAISARKFKINTNQVKRYLVNGYRSLYKSGEQFFQDVHETPRASYGYVSSQSPVQWEAFWRPVFSPVSTDLKSIVQTLRDKLFQAVSIRLRSDVPLAFCLSGGIDSAGLASIASKVCGYKVSAFSIIDPDPRYNETKNISSVVKDLRCDSFMHTLSYHENFFNRLKDLIRYHDAPVLTLSYYVHAYLSEEISKRGFKVAISGSGADELFSGYYDHFLLHLAMLHKHDSYGKHLESWKKHILPVVRNPFLRDPDLFVKNPKFRGHIYLDRQDFLPLLQGSFDEDFYEYNFTEDLLRNRMMNELFFEGIPVILHEDDLNSMRYSLENRSPYLDKNLFEYAYTIPSEFLINDGHAKFLLRQALEGILVDDVRLDRTKRGFNASLESLIDLSDAKNRETLLEESPLFDIIKRQVFEEIIKNKNLSNSYSKFIFNVINAKFFIEQFS